MINKHMTIKLCHDIQHMFDANTYTNLKSCLIQIELHN